MSEAFVYCWTNHTTEKLYVGYHKGSVDDGYICSSKSEEFWNDFNNKEMKWSRQIIANGTVKECKVLETKILQSLNLKEHYNNSAGGIVEFTDEIRNKMSEAKKGKTHSVQTRNKMSESQKKRTRSSDISLKISAAKKGKNISSDGMKGIPKSEEHREKLSKIKKEQNSKMTKEEKKNKFDHSSGKTWKLINGKRVWMEKK